MGPAGVPGAQSPVQTACLSRVITERIRFLDTLLSSRGEIARDVESSLSLWTT